MWVERTKNGKFKFVEQYTCAKTNKKKRVYATFDKNTPSTNKKAMAILYKKIEENNSVDQDTKIQTFKDVVDDYLEYIKNNKKSSSYKVAKSNLYNTYSDILDYGIDMVTANDLQKCIDSSNCKKSLYLKSVLTYAHKNSYTRLNLGSKLRLETNKKSVKVKYLEKEEIDNIINTLKSKGTYRYMMASYIIQFIMQTGLRIGECIALTYEDVKGNVLSINKTFYGKSITSPKTEKSIRDIYLNEKSLNIINEITEYKNMLGIQSDVIFCNIRGNHYLHSNLSRCLSVFKGVGFHTFRHTYASILFSSGIPLDVIQRRLGHSSSLVTEQIYIHYNNELAEKDRGIFENIEF